MSTWTRRLNADPLPWLLEPETPAVRHLALRQLLDRPEGDAEVGEARAAAMAVQPIAPILAAQHAEGYWVKPGSGYGPKYLGTTWQIVFLDQMGADGDDPRVRAGCEYVLAHSQTEPGGFGVAFDARLGPPAPSSAAHCLTGNLLRALLGFGYLEDPRVQRAIEWQARVATGEGAVRYYASVPGPGFRCGANDKQPCAWGATKVLLAFARIPPERRGDAVRDAVTRGVDLLLSVEPARASYPMGYGNTKPNGSWFKLGFPSGYVSDVLQILEALCELGYGADPRLQSSLDWLLAKQDAHGRWKNEYAYTGKTWADVETQGQPSKWVTLRACRVLKSSATRAATGLAG